MDSAARLRASENTWTPPLEDPGFRPSRFQVFALSFWDEASVRSEGSDRSALWAPAPALRRPIPPLAHQGGAVGSLAEQVSQGGTWTQAYCAEGFPEKSAVGMRSTLLTAYHSSGSQLWWLKRASQILLLFQSWETGSGRRGVLSKSAVKFQLQSSDPSTVSPSVRMA